jgi:hypothetical protein
MKRDVDYLKGIAQQVEDGLITLAEAMHLIAGNDKLTDEQWRLVDQAVIDCRSCGGAMCRVANGPTLDEGYAYAHPAGGIVWGLNSHELGNICIARGIRD